MGEDSILISVKKLLGIAKDYEHFDTDVIIHINSAFSILTQLGVGPPSGFIVSGADTKWNDFISDLSQIEMIKSYVYQKVRLMFDPPASSAAIDALQRSINEFEWRINVAVDPSKQDEYTKPESDLDEHAKITATSERLGHVKIGKNIKVSEDGTISTNQNEFVTEEKVQEMLDEVFNK